MDIKSTVKTSWIMGRTAMPLAKRYAGIVAADTTNGGDFQIGLLQCKNASDSGKNCLRAAAAENQIDGFLLRAVGRL
jgi:hypothetical protein